MSDVHAQFNGNGASSAQANLQFTLYTSRGTARILILPVLPVIGKDSFQLRKVHLQRDLAHSAQPVMGPKPIDSALGERGPGPFRMPIRCVQPLLGRSKWDWAEHVQTSRLSVASAMGRVHGSVHLLARLFERDGWTGIVAVGGVAMGRWRLLGCLAWPFP